MPNDLNQSDDVFLKDRETGELSIVGSGLGGGKPDSASYLPSLSADGRFIAFVSHATNLVAGDNDGDADMFVFDRVSGTTTLVSKTVGGGDLQGAVTAGAISADGTHVVFWSNASNLVLNDTNNRPDVFVANVATQIVVRASIAADGSQASEDGGHDPSISGDGRFVTFESSDPLVSCDVDQAEDVFVRDLATGTTSLLSVGSTGEQRSGRQSRISSDGESVLFSGYDATLGDESVLAHHIDSSETTPLVDNSPEPPDPYAPPDPASPDADGNRVAFSSHASDLVPNDHNGAADVFLLIRPANDPDMDGVDSIDDVCEMTYDPAQEDSDGDSSGNSCDRDRDGDGIDNRRDICPDVSDETQADFDGDDLGDACDSTPTGPASTKRVSLSQDGGDPDDFSFHPHSDGIGRTLVFASYAFEPHRRRFERCAGRVRSRSGNGRG